MTKPKQWYVVDTKGRILLLTRNRKVAVSFAKGYRGSARAVG